MPDREVHRHRDHAVDVFFSYSHRDEELLQELAVHLAPLKRESAIRTWYDREIPAGGEWADEIAQRLEAAELILLLISPDFIASDFCFEREMKRAMERHEAGAARVIPIILRPADWHRAPFGKLQALPRDGMPVTSWNDRDQALLNVEQGIRGAIEDIRRRAARGRRWNVPYPKNPYFTGREDVLGELRRTLTRDGTAALGQTRAISGLGGIGKTETAVEYAWRYRDEYGAVLFVRADTKAELIAGFGAIARRLGLAEAREQEEIVAAVLEWLTENAGWLLIFDNADVPERLRGYLPVSHRGDVLVTSRAQVFDVLGIRQPFCMSDMTPGEALDFLLKRTDRDEASAEERTAATELAAALGWLPLALEQAGAYILARKARFQDYLASYRRRGVEILDRGTPVAGSHPDPVATTWSLNFRDAEEMSPASADLLRASAFLSPDDVPLELLTAGGSELGPTVAEALEGAGDDPLVVDELLQPLSRYSLIQRDVEARTYGVHRLVQAVVKQDMTEVDRRGWAERVVRALNRAFPDGEFASWPLCDRLLPHVAIAVQLVEEFSLELEATGRLLNQAAGYLWYRARYAEAEPLFRRSLEIREKTLGKQHPDVGKILNNLAVLYRAQGRYAEAEPLFRCSLEIFEKTLGKEHPEVAQILNNLAILYGTQDRYTEAEPLFRRSLEIREKILGKEHPDMAQTLNNLALLYHAQDRYAEAEPLLRRSLEISEKTLGKEHPDIAKPLNSLALLYHAQGRYAEAEPLFRRSLEIKEETLGKEHPSVATTLENYATLLRETGRDEEAAELDARARRVRDRHARMQSETVPDD